MKPGFIVFLVTATAMFQSVEVVAARDLDLITSSATGPASLSAGGNSFGPVISADGRRVAFVSHAGNLVTNDTLRESLQVFVRDLVMSNTLLISISRNGRGGNANSFGPMLSSNGQFVVFASEAGDLVSNDTNGLTDVFVHDLASHATAVVSVEESGRTPGFEASRNPLISADGRWVYFESGATILTGQPDPIGSAYVYRRDLQSNSTALVSKNPFSTNATSALRSITPNGRRVAFTSATNNPFGPINRQTELFVHDVESNVTVWASSSLTTHVLGYRCVSAALSESGSAVAFIVVPNDGPPVLYLREIGAASPVMVASNVLERSTPQISAGGRYVIFEDGTNVFRFDATTGTNELVNVTTSGAPPLSGMARHPVATPDGNGIAFISNCPELVTNGSALFQIYARDMGAGTTRLITSAMDDQPSATNSTVSLMAVARDFSHVAFDSAAADLVESDGNRANDVFIRELATSTTSLLSRRDPVFPRRSGVAHAAIGSDAVSAAGAIVAFSSYDNDLLPGDANLRPDIFIHDIVTGLHVAPGFSTNAACSPAVSANGRYVAYLRRNPIYPFETTGGAVWRFDRETGTNELVAASSQRDPAISSNGNLVAFIAGNNLIVRDMAGATNYSVAPAEAGLNRQPVFTPEGRFLLFASTSPLTAKAGSWPRNLYAWDRVQRQIQLVSQLDGGDVGVNGSFAISANSRFVAFNDFSSARILTRDLIEQTNQVLRFNARAPALNGDGTLMVFIDATSRLVTLNTASGQEAVVSETGDFFTAPAISADGRFVIFSRRLPSPLASDSYASQLYVRDRTLGVTTLVSAGREGAPANAHVSRAVLAADGRTVVFHSMASDLVSGDYNDKRDIFVLKLGGADTDGDGMDDDWEVAYFGNLTRNGAADFDGDGTTDASEFLTGTDPTNNGSVFRVLTVTPLAGGSTRLLWTGNPSRSYRAEFKDNIETAAWSPLNGAIAWEGSTASITDIESTNSAVRFYRVVRLP